MEYSAPFSRDERYEYRYVTVPVEMMDLFEDTSRPLYEHEWRSIGIQQSVGWQHIAFFK
jgi:hypothetical protein